jgi:hypothetical protein
MPAALALTLLMAHPTVLEDMAPEALLHLPRPTASSGVLGSPVKESPTLRLVASSVSRQTRSNSELLAVEAASLRTT